MAIQRFLELTERNSHTPACEHGKGRSSAWRTSGLISYDTTPPQSYLWTAAQRSRKVSKHREALTLMPGYFSSKPLNIYVYISEVKAAEMHHQKFWCVDGIGVRLSALGDCFNGLYPFTHNNSCTSCIWAAYVIQE
jgi:hypothetical protein